MSPWNLLLIETLTFEKSRERIWFLENYTFRLQLVFIPNVIHDTHPPEMHRNIWVFTYSLAFKLAVALMIM